MPHSYLFVPGDQPDKINKAIDLEGQDAPDVVIIDLEDSVAPAHKTAARENAAHLTVQTFTEVPKLFVRINQGSQVDLEGVIGAGLAGIIVPKASAVSVFAAIRTLREASCSAAVIALIETATGIEEVEAIAATPGLAGLAIGEVDLGAELGIATDASWAWWPLRMRLVTSSAAAGLAAPIGPVGTNVRDIDAFSQSTHELQSGGFGARFAIHPTQVGVINQIMRPSQEELDRQAALVARYDEALASGVGAIVDADGRMIDEAVIKRYRRT